MGFWHCVCGVREIMDTPFCPQCRAANPEVKLVACETPAAPSPEDSGTQDEASPEPQAKSGRKGGNAKG